MTPDAAAVVVGLVLGGAIGWLAAKTHGGTAMARAHATLQARAASLEMLADELRKQLTQRELEAADLRAAGDTERTRRAQAEAHAEAARRNVEEQRRLLDEARERLADTFKALSTDALRQTNEAFVKLAAAELGRRHDAIDAAMRPLQDTLARYEEQARSLEAARQQAYGGLESQLQQLATSSAVLSEQAGNLVTALRAPQVRGRWGEITLHRVVELAGMVERCDFTEQVTVDGEGGRLRPDMVVHLPGGRHVVVDAKVPLAAYLDAVSAATPEARGAGFVRHAQQVRQHMLALAGREYAAQLPDATDLVVMFIPGEAFFAAAVEADRGLIEDGIDKGIVIATPMTLIALLRAVAFGWNQERLAANAREVSDLGRDLYRRVATFAEHFGGLGAALDKAVAAFNRAVGSLESRVLPAARRFRDLGPAKEDPAIESLAQVDAVPRAAAAEVGLSGADPA